MNRIQTERLLAQLDPVMKSVAKNWVEWYPHGICTIYSLLSAPILRVALAEPDLRVVVGQYKTTNHCWIESTDSWVIDQTCNQFDTSLTRSWVLLSPGTRSVYHVDHVLDLEEEAHYRNTIDPSGSTGIKQDFWTRDRHLVRMEGRPA